MLARTDDLLEGYWCDRSATKEKKYRPLREALAKLTEAMVSQATLVISLSIRGSLCESEWRSKLKPLDLFPSTLSEIRRVAVLSAVQAAGTV